MVSFWSLRYLCGLRLFLFAVLYRDRGGTQRYRRVHPTTRRERAKIQASEAEIRSEDALLLDPCVDHPEDHLIFDLKGKVASSTERGRASIEIFRLTDHSSLSDEVLMRSI